MNNSKSTQLNELKELKIQETSILAGLVHLRELVAIKPIAENLNLDWSSTRQRLERDHKLGQLSVLAPTISADGKKREMLCLPIGAFQDWLWGLQVTDKMNVALWEQYKKDLVLNILLMLKISIEEIQRLRAISTLHEKAKDAFDEYLKVDEKAKDLLNQGKEYQKRASELKAQILEITTSTQLDLFADLDEAFGVSKGK